MTGNRNSFIWRSSNKARALNVASNHETSVWLEALCELINPLDIRVEFGQNGLTKIQHLMEYNVHRDEIFWENACNM